MTGVRHRKKLIGAGVLTIVAVIGIAVAADRVDAAKARHEPQVEAMKYANALAAGDFERVLELVQPETKIPENEFLTADVLAGNQADIAKPRVDDVRVDGDEAVVTVAFTVDGTETTQDVTLERTGTRYELLDVWRIAEVELPSVTVRADDTRVLAVNDVRGVVTTLQAGIQLNLFPGTYDILPVGSTKFLRYETADKAPPTITTTDEDTDLLFRLTPTDLLLPAVQEQASGFLMRCLSMRVTAPRGCPNSTDETVHGITWLLDKEPTYEIVRDRQDGEDGYAFRTVTAGKASFTGHAPGAPQVERSGTVDLVLGGQVFPSVDSAVINVDDRDRRSASRP